MVAHVGLPWQEGGAGGAAPAQGAQQMRVCRGRGKRRKAAARSTSPAIKPTLPEQEQVHPSAYWSSG